MPCAYRPCNNFGVSRRELVEGDHEHAICGAFQAHRAVPVLHYALTLATRQAFDYQYLCNPRYNANAASEYLRRPRQFGSDGSTIMLTEARAAKDDL